MSACVKVTTSSHVKSTSGGRLPGGLQLVKVKPVVTTVKPESPTFPGFLTIAVNFTVPAAM
jgi:hypothetical protein